MLSARLSGLDERVLMRVAVAKFTFENYVGLCETIKTTSQSSVLVFRMYFSRLIGHIESVIINVRKHYFHL